MAGKAGLFFEGIFCFKIRAFWLLKARTITRPSKGQSNLSNHKRPLIKSVYNKSYDNKKLVLSFVVETYVSLAPQSGKGTQVP